MQKLVCAVKNTVILAQYKHIRIYRFESKTLRGNIFYVHARVPTEIGVAQDNQLGVLAICYLRFRNAFKRYPRCLKEKIDNLVSRKTLAIQSIFRKNDFIVARPAAYERIIRIFYYLFLRRIVRFFIRFTGNARCREYRDKKITKNFFEDFHDSSPRHQDTLQTISLLCTLKFSSNT